MVTADKKTLIHDLYLELKQGLKECQNHSFIVDLVFPYYLDTTDKKTSISRNSKYLDERNDDFRVFSKYILNENTINEELNITYERIRKDSIASFLKICIKENYLNNLKETLIRLLKETDIHPDNKLKIKLISLIERQKIIDRVNSNLETRWFGEWVDVLYYYFYYAVTDKLHSNIAFSAYPELEDNLDEYNNKVTLMYGVCGNPGMYQLYSMAERANPNIIALYECGELEYYGKGPSGVVSHQNAYKFYEKTREYNSEHPLALWSIAYMKFHYDKEKAKNDKRYRVEEFEEELKNGYSSSWYNSIISYAQTSYDYGCSAAANLLGKIVDASEDVFPLSKKGIFKYEPSDRLYKESADGGYVYGCNNYANCCLKKANAASGEKKLLFYEEAIEYLEKSAKLGNPWANNKMGTYYLSGLSVEGKMIIAADNEKAYSLFASANIMCRAEDYYWPFINLCVNFWLNSESIHYKEMDCDWIKEELEYAEQYSIDSAQVDSIKQIKVILNEKTNRKD